MSTGRKRLSTWSSSSNKVNYSGILGATFLLSVENINRFLSGVLLLSVERQGHTGKGDFRANVKCSDTEKCGRSSDRDSSSRFRDKGNSVNDAQERTKKNLWCAKAIQTKIKESFRSIFEPFVVHKTFTGPFNIFMDAC